MKNLYVIVGKSASGKDTILNSLIDKGIGNKIISHTSRPIREGEVDGFSYYFMDKNWFLDKKDTFIQTLLFNDWYYCISKDEIEKVSSNPNNKYFIILSPEGVKFLNDYVIKNNKSSFNLIYIKTSNKTRHKRLLGRNDDISEVNRRLKTDDIDFKNIEDFNPVVINGELDKEKVFELVLEVIVNE